MTRLEEMVGMAGKYRRPRQRRMLALTVQRRVRISPHFVFLTVGETISGTWSSPGTTGRAACSSARPAKAGRAPDQRAVDAPVRSPAGRVPAGGEVLDPPVPAGPTPGATWQLLVGDESAVPAIRAILEQPLRVVPDAELRPEPFYTWTAGEPALPTGLRRHLVDDRNAPKSDIAVAQLTNAMSRSFSRLSLLLLSLRRIAAPATGSLSTNSNSRLATICRLLAGVKREICLIPVRWYEAMCGRRVLPGQQRRADPVAVALEHRAEQVRAG
ncbi:hypothetical protein ACN27F_28095 [Solwaraspora sp. WMMB335]|uniref:hypothetical protein n=1 Tax=Solwaraspora sp. WMMB335 TaxID=3404118 RepID=UPI003B9357AA